ncbi:F0F1 ATP synthase subunit delta [Buchnera aphidicola]|uniref:ATP synthase subunit delta n=1 Tax=Buchnera aphidicola (Sarucallis kahawaluokalani) TaxID=1241878 RepID=A0A4D6Y851_9GAMM|nr:F0F1 ATP synthase subunit delta [Buchnera aphidicola]QCI25817.1 F0F1 ATP synthase subunit delta [Buchnera aphidicola (Sarucallis kahawaluokalani)]
MQNALIVSRAYATAIFNLAIKKKSFEEWKEFLLILSNISHIKNLHQFFSSIYPNNIILKIILSFFNKNVNSYGKNFIQLIIMNKRLYLMHDIFKQFITLYNEYHNILKVKLITIQNLKKQQKEKISSILEKKFNKRIILTCESDPSILYGYIIRYNNIVIDNSILNRFCEFSNFLIS